MCVSIFLTLALHRNHLERYHKNEENFHVVCQAPGCSKSYEDFEGYKSHLRRKHRDILNKVLHEPSLERNNQEVAENHFPCSEKAEEEVVNSSACEPGDESLRDERQEQNIQDDGQDDVFNEDTVKRLNAA